MFGPRIQKFYRNLVMDTMKQRDEQNIVRPDMIHLLMQVRQGTLKHEEVVDTKDAGFATVTESEIGKSSNNISNVYFTTMHSYLNNEKFRTDNYLLFLVEF